MGMADHAEIHSLFIALSYAPDGTPPIGSRTFPSGLWFRALDEWWIVGKPRPADGRGISFYRVTDLAGDLDQVPEHVRRTAILDDTYARIFDDFPDYGVDGIDWQALKEHENAAARRAEPRKEQRIDRWM